MNMPTWKPFAPFTAEQDADGTWHIGSTEHGPVAVMAFDTSCATRRLPGALVCGEWEYDRNAAREIAQHIVRACNSHDALVAALSKVVAAAKSWHDTHGHSPRSLQCDWLCECIAPGEAALKAATGEA